MLERHRRDTRSRRLVDAKGEAMAGPDDDAVTALPERDEPFTLRDASLASRAADPDEVDAVRRQFSVAMKKVFFWAV
jgi:hypothetical protein